MEGRLLLDVVVLKGAAILELLASEDESLLIWGNSFLILDLGLNVLDGVTLLDIKGDGLASESLDEDLHTTAETEDEMEGGFLLDVVVLKSAAVLELLTSEDESLLIWGNSLFVLDLGLDILNGVALLNIKGDGLAGEGLHEDLHTTTESEDEMESGLLLDVVVGQGASIFELLSSEDKSLLIGRNTFLVLDLGLDVLNGVRWLNLKGDGLSSESLDEDLHTSTKSEDQVKSGFLLDVVIGEGAAILELLSSKDESLLIRWDTFLVLDLGLHILDGVRWLDLKGDGLTSQSLDENLHVVFGCFVFVN